LNAPMQAQATSPVLVTGGTGRLGHLVVARLQDAGRPVRVLSRRPHEAVDGIEYVTGDLATGDGLDSAVRGTEIVAYCAGSFSFKKDALMTANLLRAATGARTRHLVYISVVGADRVPTTGRMDRNMFGYFASKLAQERAVAASGVPWTTLRATQFHDALLVLARAMAKLPVIPVPAGFRFQPIDTGEVASRFVDLALGAPSGRAPDMAGPRAYDLAEIVRAYLQVARKHRPILSLPLPGAAARAVRDGALLSPEAAMGRRTWEDFLAEEFGSPSERISTEDDMQRVS
jgi:uncharacterized protein YbjT (DUF2867 family)